MKYIICDIDGTLVDSRHRNNLLPAFIGNEVIRSDAEGDIAPGTKGKITAWGEEPGKEMSVVKVQWEGVPVEFSYSWTEFMRKTNASWAPWHDAIPGDTPIPAWVWLIKAIRFQLVREGAAIMFLTSRHESSREATIQQLRDLGVTFPGNGDRFEMRAEDDPRKDTVFKGEVLNRYEAAGHSFLWAIDDRGSVANFMRARGIPALHCAEYN